MNLYTYCGNNPVILVDPYGLCSSGYDWSGVFTGMGSAYVNDVKNYFVGIATAPGDYYHSFRGTGMGRASSVLQAANMTAGRVVGYSTLAEGIEGVDVRDVRETHGLERGFQLVGGGLQTATFVWATGGTIDAIRGANPLNSAYYGEKILNQMDNASDLYHSFPKLIDGTATMGDVGTAVGGDGVARTSVQIPGAINGVEGTYMWIIERSGEITHRFFHVLR